MGDLMLITIHGSELDTIMCQLADERLLSIKVQHLKRVGTGVGGDTPMPVRPRPGDISGSFREAPGFGSSSFWRQFPAVRDDQRFDWSDSDYKYKAACLSSSCLDTERVV